MSVDTLAGEKGDVFGGGGYDIIWFVDQDMILARR